MSIMRGGTNNVEARMPAATVGAGTRRLLGVSKFQVEMLSFAGETLAARFLTLFVFVGLTIMVVVVVVMVRRRLRGKTHRKEGDEVPDHWPREKGESSRQRCESASDEATDGLLFGGQTDNEALNYPMQHTTILTNPSNTLPQFGTQVVNLDAANAEAAASKVGPVRRTSYSRTIDSVPLQGEVAVTEGWKRHTRVYGGGVCEACEESAAKMRAMGFVVV